MAASAVDALTEQLAGLGVQTDVVTIRPKLNSLGKISTSRLPSGNVRILCLDIWLVELTNASLIRMPELVYPRALTHLDLSFNQLEEIPSLKDIKLIYLNVKNNRLRQLPEMHGFLQHLDASGNQLASVGRLPEQLVILHLEDNPLTVMGESVLFDLMSVDLHNTMLTELPEWMSRSTKLTNLQLRGTTIRRLPRAMYARSWNITVDVYVESLPDCAWKPMYACNSSRPETEFVIVS